MVEQQIEIVCQVMNAIHVVLRPARRSKKELEGVTYKRLNGVSAAGHAVTVSPGPVSTASGSLRSGQPAIGLGELIEEGRGDDHFLDQPRRNS